jgi:aconitate hydratase
MANTIDTLTPFAKGKLHSIPALAKQGFPSIARLPVSIRIVLESLLRNLDGKRVSEQDVKNLAGWKPNAERTEEVPFVVGRVLLQDFTGVPLLVDLAAMRSALDRMKKDARKVEPLVPVDLVIDHSVQVDVAGSADALQKNMDLEFERNGQRYEFLKWGMQAFSTFGIVPPGVGICHQVNMEYLAKGVLQKDGITYPDTLLGTDSHTVMINGLGVVGWGVGGIEAEAAMLGQPTYFLTPDVVGVHLTGSVKEGVTATDVVLTVTEMLRKAKVVGKFVEFHGEGAASLPAAERATIANMAPEYGATIGFFPTDEKTLAYFAATGRSQEQVETLRAYCEAQGIFGIPRKGQCDYTQVLELDLAGVKPSVAGPKRPQDRIEIANLKEKFLSLLTQTDANGFGKPAAEIGKVFDRSVVKEKPKTALPMSGQGSQNPRLADAEVKLRHGEVLIAAITSCTNTSNPGVMLAAGLLAKKAVEKGLTVSPRVKTSLAPGSRIVSEYLEKTGLQKPLDQLGFQTVGYGCTTCIGNSGPLDPRIEAVLADGDVVGASVLSGNRNFEARVHQAIKANFLMSPPLVVAFALAGRVDIDLVKEPIGKGKDGKDVFLSDIWPSLAEVGALLETANDAKAYQKNYADFSKASGKWSELKAKQGALPPWDAKSTYIQEPPYFQPFAMEPGKPAPIQGARALAIFGDSITTDHISPAGNIKASSPAGLFLQSRGVAPADFNSYGARRGGHDVMVRGTFANVRIKNLMVKGKEGGITLHQPDGKELAIYDAAMAYQKEATPLVVIAGLEYGTGSSRDWAAKGTALLGVRAVVAKSFERIHRSNLIGMGVLACQFKEGTDAGTLGLDGTETFDLAGIEKLEPRMTAKLVVHRKNGKTDEVPVTVRIDTPIEVEYYGHGGILPYVLRQIAARA